MFGGKQLHEIGYDELATFLEEKREEGVRLDYKERWTDRIIETACAFANTYGGYLLYGIKEVQQRNRPNQPDPDDIPGVDFSKGDPAASLRSRILDNTRPPVELEIRSVPLKGSKDRGALIARIDESPAAPHEVLLPGATRIPVRRADTTVAASLDEIERLVQRRDALLSEGARTIDLEFFRELLGGPKDGFGQQRIRPVVGMMTQPRRIGGLNFVFDSRLDRKIREMALQNEVNDVMQKKAMPSGLVLEDAERGTPDVRVEIHNNGMIRGARALYVESSSRIESSGGGGKGRRGQAAGLYGDSLFVMRDGSVRRECLRPEKARSRDGSVVRTRGLPGAQDNHPRAIALAVLLRSDTRQPLLPAARFAGGNRKDRLGGWVSFRGRPTRLSARG